MRAFYKTVCVLIASICYCIGVNGQTGWLDSTFDADGKVTTDFNGSESHILSLALQTDGKIVAAGATYTGGNNNDFALVRYNTDGSLDSTFGMNGILISDLGGQENANAVTLQPDGKIVAAGNGNNDFALARYNSNGTPDSSFGNNGIAITNCGSNNDCIYSLVLQSSGKIVVSGIANVIDTTVPNFSLARYDTTGVLDSTFGQNGFVNTSIGQLSICFASAIQPDDKIVVAGETIIAGHEYFAIARYTVDGTLDTAFDVDGIVTTNFPLGNYNVIAGIAIQPDGKIVAAGIVNYDVGLARYNNNGQLDNTFNGTGKVVTDITGGSDAGHAIALQQDGKIVVAGHAIASAGNDFLVIRYNVNGSIDGTFGNAGHIITGFGNGDDDCVAVAIQPDGKIIGGGFTSPVNHYCFGLARYLPDLNVGTLTFTAHAYSTLVYPNPIANHVMLEYNLPADTYLTITLADMQGHVVKRFLNNILRKAGDNKEQLLFDNSIASGNYVLNIENAARNKIAIKVIKK